MKIAISQLNPCVGDLEGNFGKILDAANLAYAREAEVLVVPAYALTGAPLDGLMDSDAFLDDCANYIDRLGAEAPITVLLGSLSPFATEDGVALSLPELFALGEGNAQTFGVPMTEPDTVPLYDDKGLRIGIALDDHFMGSASLPDGGLDVLVELAADDAGDTGSAPVAWGMLDRQKEVARANHAWFVSVNLCGAADDIVFAGNSLVITPEGELLHASPLDEEDFFVFDTSQHPAETPIRPVMLQLSSDEIIWTMLKTGTRDYILKNKFTDVVLGISGGIDSAVVSTLAVDALGPEHVHGVLMPSQYSSDGSITDAEQLAENLGIETVTLPISVPFEAFKEVLGEACGGEVTGVTSENLQARIRCLYLMALSNAHGWIVLNTGNKSESAMGFSTLYGDTVGAYAPIGDVYKTEVYRLARWRNTVSPVIPEACITKAPSAELYEGAKDQDRLPPYDALDSLLFDHIEGNLGAGALREAGHAPELVEEVLPKVQANEYKRRLEPMAPAVSMCLLNDERNWPITNGWVDHS